MAKSESKKQHSARRDEFTKFFEAVGCLVSTATNKAASPLTEGLDSE